MDSMILLLVILAGAATLQFYKGRKLNLMLMKHYLNEIEDVIKPVDKEYVWLGGYVGYKAKYKTSGQIEVETTLTLLPRQSLLYFPIALITSRHDKLFLVFRLIDVKGNAHLIQKEYFRIKPKIEEEELLNRDYVDINGVSFEVLFDDRKLADRLIDLVKMLPEPRNIKHISFTSKTDVFYVFMKPEPENVKEYLKTIYRFVRSVS
jgi:hypothetical protein